VVWLLAGAALRPVERMRGEASAISSADSETRLEVPETGDELARLASTLNNMLDRLREASAREHDFVNKASHELRTPLSVLKAELEMALSGDRTPGELRTSLRGAAGETDRLVRLAEDLLVLARSSDGRLPIHRTSILLEDIANRSARTFATRASEAGVSIVVDSDGGTASLDPDRVRQALDNLVDNALRHSPRGGTVVVRTAHENGSVVLQVQDEGTGFAEAIAGREFESFTEADGTGAGLGLAIVSAVAEGHGGDASAENLPAAGARVTITIPN
jgi:signal transduction histidine kinase